MALILDSGVDSACTNSGFLVAWQADNQSSTTELLASFVVREVTITLT